MHRLQYLPRRKNCSIVIVFIFLSCCMPIQSLINNSNNNAVLNLFNTKPKVIITKNNKQLFLDALDTMDGMNAATPERTALLQALIQDNPTPRPGAQSSFQPIAPGTWTVIYAPHITTMARVLGNTRFDPILYQMRDDGTMTSHVRWTLPSSESCWLSVSGTFSSRDNDQICRVDFDQAWVKWNTNVQDQPYPTLQDVPSSWWKTIIQTLGRLGFIESFSVFPVAYLDNDLIVFDFELLGTRICARKICRNDMF